MAAEQPRHADPGRRDRAGPHGRRAAGGIAATRSARSRPWRSTSPTLLPDLHWPAQIELRAGRHVVRPRYEVTRAGRTRIAHVNVERADLQPDPGIAALPAELGRGYLLPFPVLPRDRFRTIVQPTPMARRRSTCRCGWTCSTTDGRKVAERFLGRLPRDHDLALDLDELDGAATGHAELVYDFRDGGERRRLAARAVPLRGPRVRPRRGVRASARICSTR